MEELSRERTDFLRWIRYWSASAEQLPRGLPDQRLL